MKKRFVATSLVLGMALAPFALIACGDSGGDGAGGGSSTTSGQNCTSEHLCVNGVCNCGADGKGKSCTDNDKCDAECQVCQ